MVTANMAQCGSHDELRTFVRHGCRTTSASGAACLLITKRTLLEWDRAASREFCTDQRLAGLSVAASARAATPEVSPALGYPLPGLWTTLADQQAVPRVTVPGAGSRPVQGQERPV